MKSSPTKSWWDKFKEAVRSLPDGPVNTTEPGKPIPMLWMRHNPQTQKFERYDPPDVFHVEHPEPDVFHVEQLLASNSRLLEENQRLRQDLRNAKLSEGALARRAECLRQTWPAIHKKFFTVERKTP